MYEEKVIIYHVEDLMRMLKISRRTVYNAISDGELRGNKVSGRWEFTEENILNYIKGVYR